MSRHILKATLLLLLIFAGTHGLHATDITYQYDQNGNLITDGGRFYEYNDANQLVRVRQTDASGPVIAEYFYDHQGQRIKKIENEITTYYIGKHYETQVTNGTTRSNSYYFANGERVAKKDSSGNLIYYHPDHLGGTNVLSDASGNLIERTSYYPFGEIREGGEERYAYTGKERDAPTSLYYYEARYYDPGKLHFTQADTANPNLYNPQDLNLYSYVGNNPLSYVDPDGHKKHHYDLSKREKLCIESGTDPDKHHNKYRNLSKHEQKTVVKSKHSNQVSESTQGGAANSTLSAGIAELASSGIKKGLSAQEKAQLKQQEMYYKSQAAYWQTIDTELEKTEGRVKKWWAASTVSIMTMGVAPASVGLATLGKTVLRGAVSTWNAHSDSPASNIAGAVSDSWSYYETADTLINLP